jgi:hypothetical protein
MGTNNIGWEKPGVLIMKLVFTIYVVGYFIIPFNYYFDRFGMFVW